MAFMWYFLRPNLASVFVCSLPSMLVWALTLWSVVVYVWDFNIWIMKLKNKFMWVAIVYGGLFNLGIQYIHDMKEICEYVG